MGIMSKNREEWATTQLANMYFSITQVAMYDTLGPDAVFFILEQTMLTTMSISANYLPMFTQLKKEGKSFNLTNLVVWDLPSDLQKKDAISAGFKVFSYQEVMEIGKNTSSRLPTQEPLED